MKYLYVLPFCFLLLISCEDQIPEILDMPIPDQIAASPTHKDFLEIQTIQQKQALSHIDCLTLASLYAKYNEAPALIQVWLYRGMDLDDKATIELVNHMLQMKQAISKPKYATVVKSIFYR